MYVIAVDVGTTSVRLAIISFAGAAFNRTNILASQEKEISHDQDGVKFEQSSEEIWKSICECSRLCLERSGVSSRSISSIAFSSTCSLVVQGRHDCSNTNESQRDIIMWMDHRAIDEANEITRDKHSKLLTQFGGVCSPEFSLSKLIWLSQNQPERLEAAEGLFELPDWLTFRCIGGDPSLCPRSLCCLVCKWGYDADCNEHCDIVKRKFDGQTRAKFCGTVLKPGMISGKLCEDSARELGLMREHDANSFEDEIIVGTSLIDAHSGMLAMLSIPLGKEGIDLTISSTFCSLAGTSSCHMLLSDKCNFTPGIWGPYKDVVLDGFYLLEAGQTLTGKLIEICLEPAIGVTSGQPGGRTVKDIVYELNATIDVANYQNELHILPTYHGNRSPLANPRLKGGVYGLSASKKFHLREHYIATVESIVFELKFIVETMGITLGAILVSGGLMKNEFYMQILADILECKVVKMSLESVDFMVMGAGLVARQAAINRIRERQGKDSSCLSVKSIADIEYEQLSLKIYEPNLARSEYFGKKYSCYREFVDFSKRVDKILY